MLMEDRLGLCSGVADGYHERRLYDRIPNSKPTGDQQFKLRF